MYPDHDAPWYIKAFIGTDIILATCLICYLSLPILFLLEARHRKKKYGYAMPLRAMEDASHSEATMVTMHRITENAKLGGDKDDLETAAHIERTEEQRK